MMVIAMWREFLKFANSGAIGTLAHYSVLWILVDLTGTHPVAASTAGALTGAGVNYFLNYHWTFKSRLPHSRTMPRFFAIAMFSLVLNTFLMAILISLGTLHYMVAQLASTTICLVVNYFASRFWAFGGNS